MVVGFTTTMQSVPITTNIVSSNPADGELYSIQHNMIKFVSDLREVTQWFSSDTLVFSSNKSDRHDIAEILMKVTLNTINLTPDYFTRFKCLQILRKLL